MDAEEHDAVLAAVSHLPHLLAFALVHDVAQRDNSAQLFSFAAGGFRDFTRIASSHPEMWRDICVANRDRLLAGAEAVYANEARIDRASCSTGDGAELEKLFAEARDARDAMDSLELKPARRAARHGAAAGLEEHLQPRPAARRAGEGRDRGRRPARRRRHARHARGARPHLAFHSTETRVKGVGGPFPVKKAELFLGNAGTAFRPLTAALAFSGGEYRLSGVPRMHERPIGDLVDALRGIGARIDYPGKDGFPPLAIHPAKTVAGKTARARRRVVAVPDRAAHGAAARRASRRASRCRAS